LVGRAYRDSGERLRAIASITLFGGVASTVALPTTAWLIARVGWRPSVLVLAAMLALSTWATRLFTLRGLADITGRATASETADSSPRPHFGLMTLVFALGSLGSAALMSNLVPALGERHLSPALAASLGGLLGVMQVPGRALMMHGALSASPRRLVVLCLLLQGGGLLAVATAPSAALIGASIALFAIGSGLTTLVRPHLVQTSYGIAQAGTVNGELARAQQVARAAGPVLAASLAARSSYSLVFIGLATLFALTSVTWIATVRSPR
jgi:predicted MFS family arabinose efflux permease